jgi:hypothetical protein
MNQLRALLCGAAALAMLSAAPARAQSKAAPGQAAQEAHRHALELFDRGQHGAALEEFQRAYSIAPSFRILYNIGLCEAALGDARAAIAAFNSYLRDGGEQIPPARRDQVQAELAKLEQQLVVLEVELEQAEAELRVDGAFIGRGPLAQKLRLNAGRHVVEVRSPDGSLRTQSVTLGRGEARALSFGEQPAPIASSAPPPSNQAEARPVPWLAWGITGALGLATTMTGVVALGAHADERDLQHEQGVTSDQLQQARDKVANWSLATDVLLASTAVAAGVSLYLTLKPEPSGSETAVMLAPGRVVLRRTF